MCIRDSCCSVNSCVIISTSLHSAGLLHESLRLPSVIFPQQTIRDLIRTDEGTNPDRMYRVEREFYELFMVCGYAKIYSCQQIFFDVIISCLESGRKLGLRIFTNIKQHVLSALQFLR